MPELEDPMKERFCLEVFGGLSKAKAHVAAGYKKCETGRHQSKAAYKLSQSKWFKTRISELRREAIEKSSHTIWMNQEWVLAETKEQYQRCTQAVPVLDRQGNETGEYKSEANTAQKYLLMIGQQVGLFNPEKKSRHGQLDPLDSMDQKELVQFIGRTLKELGPGAMKELGLVAIEPTSGDGKEPVEFDDSPAGPLQTVQ